MKRKIMTIVAGAAGLVLAYFVVSGISNIIYHHPAESTATQEETESAEQGTEEAKAAMTEDEIDYPILQHPSDNSYYLMHNIDGSYGYPGCIYTENLNSKDFTDNNTVIYGHNMKNGSMFAQLHKFEDPDFFQENREVLIYLPDKVLHYTIFAAHIYDDRHLLYSFDFTDPEVYEKYLQSVFDTRDMSANIDKEMTVINEDQIITLVTCIGSQPNNRLLVQAVLTEREPGTEADTAE